MQQSYDVVIIGGGVVGSAIARELSRYKLRIAVLEKESDVCTQTSGRNTGMLHAGFLYKTSSLKAICAVEGNQEFDQVARELDVPFKRTGKLIVGFTDEHRQRLEQFMARGEANGVKGLELIDRKRMDELDPSAGGNFAMWCPASGILDPFLYTIALAENAVHNGAEYHLNCAFTGETRQADGTHLLHTTRGDFHTRWVVNSAGLNSAVVSEQLGIPGYVIKPVKGEYFVLDKLAGQFAKIPVYPAPNPDNTFDTHATPTVDGNVLVGPDSQLARDFQDYESTQAAMDGLIKSGSRMFKHMDRAYFIRNFAGIRPKRIDPATGAVQDFVLECRDEAPGVVNLVGIESPGVTSALPLARRAVALIARQEALEPNPDFDPIRHGIRRFADMTDEERAAAIRLRQKGVDDVVVLEREHRPGGILRQCIHDGFGLTRFGETLSGPEYAQRFVAQAEELGITCLTDTTVLSLEADRTVTASGPAGLKQLRGDAVILTMGCRERTRGALAIPGSRPAGIYTAGVAQEYINLRNLMVGREVVILGSGDIGMIMARRMTLEGAHVRAVYEVQPYPSGLPRNIEQCLNDYGIPLYLSHTVTDIHGRARLEAVTVSQVDERLRPIPGTEERVECDTLILSVGLIPAGDIANGSGLAVDGRTRGAFVDEHYQTSIPGVFAAGNVLHVHDLVDFVSLEAEALASSAAEYLKNHALPPCPLEVRAGANVGHVIPQRISGSRDFTLSLRVSRPMKAVTLTVTQDGREVLRRRLPKALPAEMLQLPIRAAALEQSGDLEVSVQ